MTAYPRTVFHLASATSWQQAVSAPAAPGEPVVYRDPSLDEEGFIHCSTLDQLLIPANERFIGRTDLVVLSIDLDLVEAETVFEDCYESGLEFPHIYGPLPIAAVTRVVPFPPQEDGSFVLPTALYETA